jgi:hypothetical protein
MWKKLSLITVVALGLIGCNAEDVSIKIKSDQLQKTLAGADQSVPFQARFSFIGENNAETRNSINQINDVFKQYLKIDSVDMKTSTMGFNVIINGSLLMTTRNGIGDAYFLKAEKSDLIENSFVLQVKHGAKFYELKDRISNINLLYQLSDFHPTNFEFLGDAELEIFAPAVQVNGKDHFMWRGKLLDRLSLNYSGGAFDRVGAGFFFRCDCDARNVNFRTPVAPAAQNHTPPVEQRRSRNDPSIAEPARVLPYGQ